MRKKTMYCTLDTETLGGAARPEGVYNAGGTIHDREGNIYASFNYIIAEHFRKIQDKAFYGKKNFPRYQQMINCGEASMLATEEEAVRVIDSLLSAYNVKYVMAFNTGFDLIKTSMAELIKNREFIDIYEMAYTIIRPLKKYTDFCRENGFLTKGCRPQCKVETVYSFMTSNPDFEEEHTAFSDARQEMEIFVRCVKAHKSYEKNFHCVARFGWT